jgi:hypothetical protein
MTPQTCDNIINLVTLYCDNNIAIAQANKTSTRQSSKNTLKQFHLIKES